MRWTIDYYSETVRLTIEALPVGIRAAYARLTELLEEFGLDLRLPQARPMGKGLYELRPRGREGIARVFYVR
jgi:phage-related protein